MRKFKVGDKVRRFIGSCGKHRNGTVDTITHVDGYWLYFKDDEPNYRDSFYELVEEPIDLTKIDKPFGELDRETQKELLAAYYLDKNLLQFRGSSTGYWVDSVTNKLTFSSTVHYRLKPEKTPEQLHKESLQKKVEELQKEIAKIVVPE